MAWSKYYYNTTLSAWVKDGETDPSEDIVSGGETVFFRRASKGAGTLNISGEVDVQTPSESVEVSANKFAFIAYPWPVKFPVTGFVDACSKPWSGTKLLNTVDQVHRWTGMAWSKYYYNSTLGGYVKDGENELTKDEIEPGEGVFFRRSSKGACTLTFTKPEGL